MGFDDNLLKYEHMNQKYDACYPMLMPLALRVCAYLRRKAHRSVKHHALLVLGEPAEAPPRARHRRRRELKGPRRQQRPCACREGRAVLSRELPRAGVRVRVPGNRLVRKTAHSVSATYTEDWEVRRGAHLRRYGGGDWLVK